MVGRRIESPWHGLAGEVIRYEPLGSAMTDALVRCTDGREVWVSLSACRPADGLGPLPDRAAARSAGRQEALAGLREIRAQHVADFRRPWPGCEHGKAFVGRAIDGAIGDTLAAAGDGVK